MYISAFPTFSFSKLIKRKKAQVFSDYFGYENTRFFYRGAYAIFYGVKALGLKPKDTVLVPAYHCGIEINAILKAGINVKFYDVTHELEVDIESIKSNIDEHTKAVFVIHYYGFPQEMVSLNKLCQTHGLKVIEDCAHGLFSFYKSKSLGAWGDISVFSFQKSLPTADGGAIVFNDRKEDCFITQKKPALLTTLRAYLLLYSEHIHMFKGFLFSVFNTLILKPSRFILKILKRGGSKVITANTNEFDAQYVSLGPSGITEKLIDSIDAHGIVVNRRRNYQHLLEGTKHIKNIKLLFNNLPVGVCPLFFPIRVNQRDLMQQYLSDHGIETFIFGKKLHNLLPKEQCPVAWAYSDELLCLPIHQDMNPGNIEYILKVLEDENCPLN